MTSRYESISDDALFGSGTDSWNNTTDTSSQLTNENIVDNMTLQNTDDSKNTRRSNGRSPQQQVLHQIPGSSQTSDEIIQPVYDPSTIIQSTNTRREPVEDMGARAKVLKNNENRTKNGTKKSQHVKNGENKVVPRKFRPQDFQTTNSNWEPKLQLKKQDNSIDDEDETVLLKLANDDRHSRRKKTQNTPKSRSAPLTSSLTNSFSDNDMLSYDSIPIPAGLNPNLQQSDFQNRIYIKRSNSARTNVPNSRSDQISNLQLENQGNGNDDIFSTNQPQNVTIYNNLWEEQPRGKKQTKEENTRAGSGISVLHLNQPKNLAAVHVVNNDLEADMDPQHPAINVSNRRSLGRTNSRSRLDNPIVVPYESESKTEHTLNMDNLPCITQATPCDNIQTMNFNSSPNSLTNSSVVGEFQNSLPSDLSSNVLFGEGNSLNDQDFLFAQQLQRKYDREDEEFRQRHFDLPVHRFGVPERPSLNKQRNQHGHCRHEESSEQLVNDRNSPCGHDIDSLSTSDFVTAFPLDEDNINGTVPVYAPENNTNHSPDPIVIPYENERTSEHNDNVSGLEEVSANEPTILTIPYETLSPRLQNDESYHEIAGVQEDIHIPFDEGFPSNEISLPPVELPGNNMVARGTGSAWQPQENQQTTSGNNSVARGTGSTWQPHEDHQTTCGNNVVARETRSPWQQDSSQTLDLEYARQIQEQEDEVLARRLQEEDERRSQSHFIARRNNRRTAPRHHRRSEPLHQRFSDTWTSRPLIVSPGALNNNVADSHARPYLSSERPLVTGSGNEFSYLDNVHTLPVNEGYDIAPGPDYYYRYEHDPDYMLDEHGEDRLISINRDPQLLATLLMTRDPDMMIPNDLDLNNYEALWELAEHLGEVRRVGMDPKDIALLPVHEHKTETKTEKKDDTTFDCSVCMSEFKSGEKLKTLPCCHIYHVDCIDEWLKRNAVCPVCRRSAKQGNN